MKIEELQYVLFLKKFALVTFISILGNQLKSILKQYAVQQNSHMFAHIIDSIEERERNQHRNLHLRGKKQTKQTKDTQKLFPPKETKIGCQGFQMNYEQQIRRLELDSFSSSQRIREIVQHHDLDEMTDAKSLLIGITGNSFPRPVQNLRFIHKLRWNSLV